MQAKVVSTLDCAPAASRSRWLGVVALSCTVFTATGCQTSGELTSGLSTSLDRLSFIYRPQVVQGNVVVREQAAALRPGLTKNQVKTILGSPLLTDIFHAQRWDYVFTFEAQNKSVSPRHLSLFFKGDLLERIEGASSTLSEHEFAQLLSDDEKATPPSPPLSATPEQLQAFTQANAALNTRQAQTEVASEPVDTPQQKPPLTFPNTYPPLERQN